MRMALYHVAPELTVGSAILPGDLNGVYRMDTDTIVIDHLYYRGKLKCQLFATLDGNYGAPYISDHYPIAMVFTL